MFVLQFFFKGYTSVREKEKIKIKSLLFQLVSYMKVLDVLKYNLLFFKVLHIKEIKKENYSGRLNLFIFYIFIIIFMLFYEYINFLINYLTFLHLFSLLHFCPQLNMALTYVVSN